MKTSAFNTLSLSARLRLAVLKGMARLLAWAIAPALEPVKVASRRTAPRSGRIIDGEFRRIDEPNRW